MASNRSKPSPISASAAPPPPRTLNVQKFAECRAPELESLHEIVGSRLGHGFRIQREKRRRTTGHLVAKNRRRKRRKTGDGGEAEDGGKKVSRRARRRAELQRNPLTGFCVSGDGMKRLRTHLWHAKRFTMVKLWGFYLPLGLRGRGRGSRSILKCLKSGTLVHDASYCSPIQLDGPEDSVLSVLKMVLLPSISDDWKKLYKSIAYGVCYGNAMLYHVGTHLSQLIAPVMYMWRPFDRGNAHICVEQDHNSGRCSMPDENSHSNLSYRQLWIWIHAAAFNEGFDALRSACQKLMDESGVSVSCSSLVGLLGKLEVIGSKANQAIKKLLHPAPESDQAASRCSNSIEDPISRVKKSYIMHHAEQLPSNAVFSLKVYDPRDLPSTGTESIPEVAFTKQENNLQHDNVTDTSADTEDLLSSFWSEPQSNGVFLSDSEGLWDSNDKLSPPIQENILCEEKHLKRLELFCLDESNNPTPVTRCRKGSFQSCPLLLLKHKDIGNISAGWSIILPLSWAKVFWVALVSNGAHAIGIREKRWVGCNNGLPSFPFDFPDSEAYSSFMAAKCIETDRNAELRPPAAQPLKVPIPPPWSCVLSTIERGQSTINDLLTPVSQESDHEAVLEGTLVKPVSELLESSSSSSEQAVPSFQGFIPRTSDALSQYIEKKADKHLLLFPDLSLPTEENWFSCLTRCSNLKPYDRKLCFVRVLLHAYKEGFFEEDAVVCAPTPTDLSNWTSRSDEEKECLQIPQSVLKSYFSQNVSGKWELHLPADNAAWQTHRWPIGFITSGFVPGMSGKPVAVAYCEAKLISLLRNQQWSMNKKSRPEIFVLVRNLRSTAYRRALATIVLEQQKEDLDFM
ncbi:Ribonuclease P protein [Dioscorea alata]|uniref:Ribonuclease P protein n=1 Tax=Dioscorea alata TaxID=55571 RepID=A0ACB7U498_DIOAL|nr:Ribonuclease P protein [Dioscorea alata]